MKKLVLLVTLAVLADAAIATPTTYTIDPNHSLPRFSYNHFGYSTQLSRFDDISGTITIDPPAGKGSVDIAIDAKSIDSGIPSLNHTLQDAEFFDAAQYPTITFKSDRVKFQGEKIVEIDGDLTIKGTTKPVVLSVASFKCMVNPMMKIPECGAQATATIKRSDFNMAKYAPYVSDDVTLEIPVEAMKK